MVGYNNPLRVAIKPYESKIEETVLFLRSEVHKTRGTLDHFVDFFFIGRKFINMIFHLIKK